MKEVPFRELWICWLYSRGTWLRRLAKAAKLHRVAQAHEGCLSSGRAEDRGRRTETHRVREGPASPRIVLSIFQCREFHISRVRKSAESTMPSKLIRPSQTIR